MRAAVSKEMGWWMPEAGVALGFVQPAITQKPLCCAELLLAVLDKAREQCDKCSLID